METGVGEWRGVTFLFFKIYVLHFKKKEELLSSFGTLASVSPGKQPL